MAMHIRSTRGLEHEGGEAEMVLENVLVGGSRSNGVVENTIKTLQGQTRIITLLLTRALGDGIDIASGMWHWRVERAAGTFNI